MRVNSKKLNSKISVWLSAIVFVLSMLPIWYLAFYAAPMGDDLGYGTLTHQTWLATHSVIEVLKAALETSRSFYQTWNGDWFTVFLFALMPEVFASGTYWITAILFTIFFSIALTLFLYEICVKLLGMEKSLFIVLNCLVLFLSFQFVPSLSIMSYWYVGAVHYIYPHVFMLLALRELSIFCRNGKKKHIFWMLLLSVMNGGSSYQTSLILFVAFTVTIVLGYRKNKKLIWVLLPLAAGLVAFYFQCTAPGIKMRAGADFGFSFSGIFITIIESFRKGSLFLLDSFMNRSFVWIGMLVFAVIGYTALKKNRKAVITHFRYPLLVVIFTWCCICALFAPEIYSGVEISKGPITEEYLFLVTAAAVNILYVEGWILSRYGEWAERQLGRHSKILLLVSAVAAIMIVLVNRHEIKESSDYQIFDYVRSGQAADFKAQVQSQMEILLDDSIEEAYLCPINERQGPMMYMPVVEDENAFTNWATKNFYGKTKVIMVYPDTE